MKAPLVSLEHIWQKSKCETNVAPRGFADARQIIQISMRGNG